MVKFSGAGCSALFLLACFLVKHGIHYGLYCPFIAAKTGAAMKKYSIAVIPGDGIGQEVTPEGVRLLNAVAEISGAYASHTNTSPGAAGERQANFRTTQPRKGGRAAISGESRAKNAVFARLS